eukprot:Nk52_evm33s232 gene=Nk52_evmTU33s232
MDFNNRFTASSNGPLSFEEENRRQRVATKLSKVHIAHVALEYVVPQHGVQCKFGGMGKVVEMIISESQLTTNPEIAFIVPLYLDFRAKCKETCLLLTTFKVYCAGTAFHAHIYCHEEGDRVLMLFVDIEASAFSTRTVKTMYKQESKLEELMFYSLWNQAAATAVHYVSPRTAIHLHDYHAGLVPLYLSLYWQEAFPVVATLHNADVDGAIKLENNAHRRYVLSCYHLPLELFFKYIEHSGCFNILAGIVRYCALHQNGVGMVTVSQNYTDRVLKKLPLFWGTKLGGISNGIDSEERPKIVNEFLSDSVDGEAKFGSWKAEKRLALQEYYGLDKDDDDFKSTTFVFMGRMSQQKGSDLIADIAKQILDFDEAAQIVFAGPCADKIGEKAVKRMPILMHQYPGRLFVKGDMVQSEEREVLFEGADYFFMPSRFEPFGIVDVEFGWRGAVGVGLRVGGLGKVPGFYATCRTSCSQALGNNLFKMTKEALNQTENERTKMGYEALKCEFPPEEMMQSYGKLYKEVRFYEDSAQEDDDYHRSRNILSHREDSDLSENSFQRRVSFLSDYNDADEGKRSYQVLTRESFQKSRFRESDLLELFGPMRKSSNPNISFSTVNEEDTEPGEKARPSRKLSLSEKPVIPIFKIDAVASIQEENLTSPSSEELTIKPRGKHLDIGKVCKKSNESFNNYFLELDILKDIPFLLEREGDRDEDSLLESSSRRRNRLPRSRKSSFSAAMVINSITRLLLALPRLLLGLRAQKAAPSFGYICVSLAYVASFVPGSLIFSFTKYWNVYNDMDFIVISSVFAAYSLSYALCAPMWGYLVFHYPPRILLMIASIGNGLGVIFLADMNTTGILCVTAIQAAFASAGPSLFLGMNMLTESPNVAYYGRRWGLIESLIGLMMGSVIYTTLALSNPYEGNICSHYWQILLLVSSCFLIFAAPVVFWFCLPEMNDHSVLPSRNQLRLLGKRELPILVIVSSTLLTGANWVSYLYVPLMSLTSDWTDSSELPQLFAFSYFASAVASVIAGYMFDNMLQKNFPVWGPVLPLIILPVGQWFEGLAFYYFSLNQHEEITIFFMVGAVCQQLRAGSSEYAFVRSQMRELVIVSNCIRSSIGGILGGTLPFIVSSINNHYNTETMEANVVSSLRLIVIYPREVLDIP